MKTAKRVLVVLAVVALLVGALAVSSFAADGETSVTWVAKNAGYANATDVTEVKVDDVVTFECAKGSGSNAPKYYSSGYALRLYASNTMVVSVADGYELKSVVLTAVSSGYNATNASYTGDVSASTDGTVTTITPTVTGLTTFTMTNDGSSQIRLTQIVFNYAKVAQADADATDEEKVTTEINALSTRLNVDAAGAVELDTAGSTYGDVAISWASDNALAVVDNAAGTVTYTLPEAGAEDVKVTLTATLTCGEVTQTKTFEVTLVAPPAVVEGTWSLVTDASTLSVGDKIVIVAADANFAMGTNQNSNNRPQVAITKGTGTISFDETVQIITLEAGTTAGTFAFKTEEGYLFAASSGSNHLKSQASIDVNASWTITVADGATSIAATGSSNRNVMQYNQTSSIFSCYASATQKAVEVYKLNAGSLSDSEKIEVVESAVSFPEYVYKTGTELVLTAGGNGVTVEWALTAGNEYASIVDGKLVINALPAVGNTADVVLAAKYTAGTTVVDKTYTVKVKTMSAAEIVEMAYGLASGAALDGTYTITGTVNKVDTAFSTQYGNVTFTLSVEGTEKTIQAFRATGTGADIVKVGDVVTVTGSIKNYGGTIEFDKPTIDAYPNPVAINSVSLNIANNVDIYYYVSALAGFKSASASFTFNGETTTVSTYETLADGRIVFVFEGINPAELGDAVNATVSVSYAKYTYTATNEGMSVKKYYKMAQAYEGTKNDAALMTLLSDLLVYGAAAQTYVADTDALVTEGLTLTPSTNAIPESVFSAEGDAFKSIALKLGSDITVSLKVALKEGDVVNVYHNDRCTSFAEADLIADADGFYTVEFANVYASDYASTITVELNGKLLTYSVNSYINEKANDENANLAALVAALNNYGASAAAYENA